MFCCFYLQIAYSEIEYRPTWKSKFIIFYHLWLLAVNSNSFNIFQSFQTDVQVPWPVLFIAPPRLSTVFLKFPPIPVSYFGAKLPSTNVHLSITCHVTHALPVTWRLAIFVSHLINVFHKPKLRSWPLKSIHHCTA